MHWPARYETLRLTTFYVIVCDLDTKAFINTMHQSKAEVEI